MANCRYHRWTDETRSKCVNVAKSMVSNSKALRDAVEAFPTSSIEHRRAIKDMLDRLSRVGGRHGFHVRSGSTPREYEWLITSLKSQVVTEVVSAPKGKVCTETVMGVRDILAELGKISITIQDLREAICRSPLGQSVIRCEEAETAPALEYPWGTTGVTTGVITMMAGKTCAPRSSSTSVKV